MSEVSINSLLIELSSNLIALNASWGKLVDALVDKSEYVSLEEAVKLTGLTKRQVRHAAESNKCRYKDYGNRTKFYNLGDLAGYKKHPRKEVFFDNSTTSNTDVGS